MVQTVHIGSMLYSGNFQGLKGHADGSSELAKISSCSKQRHTHTLRMPEFSSFLQQWEEGGGTVHLPASQSQPIPCWAASGGLQGAECGVGGQAGTTRVPCICNNGDLCFQVNTSVNFLKVIVRVYS